MTGRTLPLDRLLAGMARSVRETILPALTDPTARIQAEALVALLDALPAALSAETARAIHADSEEARALLAEIGAEAPPRPAAEPSTLGELVAENHALQGALLECAMRARSAGDGGVLHSLQSFFVRSARREHAPLDHGADFATLSAKERSAGRKS